MHEPADSAAPYSGDIHDKDFSRERRSRDVFHKESEPCGFDDQAYLQSILRVVPAGIGIVENRILLDINQRVCDILGYEREELVGRNSRMLYLSDKDYDYVGTEKYRQIAAFGIGTVEVLMCRKDGRIINTVLSSVPLDPHDIFRGVTFTILAACRPCDRQSC